MANMFASDAADFDSTAVVVGRETTSTGFAGMFRAVVTHFALARQRRLDVEVGNFIETHGGQLTDDLERQISRKFGSPTGQW